MRRAQFSQLPNRIAAQPYPLSSSGAASHATALLANVQAAGAPLHKTAVHAVRVLEVLLLRVAWWAEAVLSSPYFALYQHTSTAIAQFAAEASFDVALKGNKMALPTLMAASKNMGTKLMGASRAHRRPTCARHPNRGVLGAAAFGSPPPILAPAHRPKLVLHLPQARGAGRRSVAKRCGPRRRRRRRPRRRPKRPKRAKPPRRSRRRPSRRRCKICRPKLRRCMRTLRTLARRSSPTPPPPASRRSSGPRRAPPRRIRRSAPFAPPLALCLPAPHPPPPRRTPPRHRSPGDRRGDSGAQVGDRRRHRSGDLVPYQGRRSPRERHVTPYLTPHIPHISGR